MANKTMDLDFEVSGYDKKPRGLSKRFNKLFLIASAGVLVVALAVAAVLLLTGPPPTAMHVLDFNTAMNGVSVGGVDISNMTRQQAIEATAQLETDMLAAAKISLDVNGQIYEFEPSALGISTDYIDKINQAMDYGHTGTIEERTAAAGTPKNFDIKLTADETSINTALANLKGVLDKAPQDAGVIFAPWGYTANADGTFTPYTPDLDTIKEMCKTYAKKQEFERPELVRIPEEEMPLAVRYEFWGKSKKYVENYRPVGANISRFIYKPEVTGLVADTSQVADDIIAQAESGTFSTITVPVQVTEPALKLADIKNDTQLIASWSSYWGGHDSYNRNYNVAMISSLINDGGILQPGSGTVLQPGVEWSVNQNVGYRTPTTARTYGWKEAPGLEDGGTTPQYGGGVCQLGSTTYNAAIRAGITIVKSVHHTIPSDYIPLGLDATLSSNTTLDLILRNDNTMPYYIVSYIDPKERNVTVEVYGPPLIDKDHPEWGNVIYKYTSESKGHYGDPQYRVIYCRYVETEAGDGTIINAENPYYEFAANRKGTRVQTYKHIYSLDGNLLWEGNFLPMYSYPVIDGKEYYWGYPPDEVPPVTPGPSPSESTEPSPSVSP